MPSHASEADPEAFHDAEAVCALMCFVDDLVDLAVGNDGHSD